MKKIVLCAVFSVILLDALTADAAGIRKQRQSGIFTYYCAGKDARAMADVARVLESRYPEICRHLECRYTHGVAVQIYPDQQSYDENVMSPEVMGFPACSGRYRIQMVSPASPIRIRGIPYTERLLMAVHEFAHLVMDEIGPNAPIWMDEGVACHEGSRDGYDHMARMAFPFLPPIGLRQLEERYQSTPAADVYSYSAVRFIVDCFGYSKLNRLIRSPESLELIFGRTRTQFDERWNEYVRSHYRN